MKSYRRFVPLACLLAVAAVFAGIALAATYERHLPAGFYPYWTASSSSFSSSWVRENSYTTQWVERTVTLIDNVSYSWHGTTRGAAPEINARWSSGPVKKGYCKLHSSGTVACTVFDYQ